MYLSSEKHIRGYIKHFISVLKGAGVEMEPVGGLSMMAKRWISKTILLGSTHSVHLPTIYCLGSLLKPNLFVPQ